MRWLWFQIQVRIAVPIVLLLLAMAFTITPRIAARALMTSVEKFKNESV